MLDIIQNDIFRQAVFDRLAGATDTHSYVFPKTVPILYRYTKFSDYSVKDIIENKVTATLNTEFNDVFDGSLHRYKDRSEAIKEEQEKWNLYNSIFQSSGIEFSETVDEYIKRQKRSIIKREIAGQRTNGYLGTYICCFSTKNDSILMWSHYADNNQGMCVSYDFNLLSENDPIRSMLFPVAYTSKPLIIPEITKSDLVNKYQTEYNVLCSALTKYNVWEYEKEWRLFCQNNLRNYPYEKRMSINMPIKTKGIFFGWHFFKQFFHYNDEDKIYTDLKIDLLYQLLDYLEDNSIDVYFMVPKSGEYVLCPQIISVKSLKKFVNESIQKNYKTDVKFYTLFLSQLAVLLEDESNNV